MSSSILFWYAITIVPPQIYIHITYSKLLSLSGSSFGHPAPRTKPINNERQADDMQATPSNQQPNRFAGKNYQKGWSGLKLGEPQMIFFFSAEPYTYMYTVCDEGRALAIYNKNINLIVDRRLCAVNMHSRGTAARKACDGWKLYILLYGVRWRRGATNGLLREVQGTIGRDNPRRAKRGYI